MKKNLFFVIVMTLFFASCNEAIDNTTINSKRIPINISMSQPQFTRATDNAYEDGDMVGLYVSNFTTPLLTTGNHVDNERFTYNSSKWKSDEALFWLDDITPADLYAYYPYEEVENVNAHQFSVQQNQNTIEGIKASYFLWGKIAGQTPTEQAISIETNHLMSSIKVCLEFDEGLTEEEIKAYNVSELSILAKTSATIDIATGIVTATENAQKITPYDEGECYRAIIIPQEGIDITIVAFGTEYTLNYDIVFQPNTQYKLTVIVNKDYLTADANFRIGGWEEEVEEHSGILNVQNLNKFILEKGIENPHEYIEFANSAVKQHCVTYHDINGDGELTYLEAALCTNIESFNGHEYDINDFYDAPFKEFQYFTSVEIIPNGFAAAFDIGDITLPPSIKYIENSAFLNGNSRITFTSEIPPTIEEYSFQENATIYVPTESTELYEEAFSTNIYNVIIVGY